MSTGNVKTYFISGFVDLDIKDFTKFYIPMISTAIEEGARFVVGDGNGTDAMAQAYLEQKLPQDQLNRVSVFFKGQKPMNYWNEQFLAFPGFVSHEEAAVAMTGCSDFDIAVLKPGREKSMTAQNVLRRFTPEFDFSKYMFAKNRNEEFWTSLLNQKQELSNEHSDTDSSER